MAKRLPKGVKRIPVDIYHTEVIVAKNKEMYEELQEAYGISDNLHGLSGCLRWLENKETGHQLALCGFFADPVYPGTVAHEMLHATLFIADYVGVKRDDDEALCYLQGYLTQKVHEYLWPS